MSSRQRAADFESALAPHVDAAYNLARWLTRDVQDAEDCLQEAFLRAFRFFDSFHGSDFRPWLLRIVRNTCYTWLSRQKDTRTLELDEALLSPESHADGAAPFEAGNPENELLRAAARQELGEALRRLPAEYREAMLLREFEEMSYKQIADITDVPIGTVMSRLARARARLRGLLGEAGVQA